MECVLITNLFTKEVRKTADKGWISLHRQIQDCWIWTDDDKFDKAHAWIDLLLLANHRDKKIIIEGIPTLIIRGQFLTSRLKLANRWNWNVKTVDKFLNLLERDLMIKQERNRIGTTITIVNYEVYQKQMDNEMDNQMDNGMVNPMVNPMDNPMVNGMDTNNNDNNVNNDNNDNNDNNVNNIGGKKRSVFKPPTVEEVAAYCQERNNNVDPSRFVDFYTSKGWMVGKSKMKDWKSAVRTWENKDNKSGNYSKNKERDVVSEWMDLV